MTGLRREAVSAHQKLYMSALFTPLQLREITIKNRLTISPMCQYAATDGFANSYHTVQYGRFALGGFGLVMVEATAVSAEGRITHGDLGLWSDAHIPGLSAIASFLKQYGATPAIQLGHAGPKASMQRPYYGDGPLNASDFERGDLPWPVVSASAQPVDEGWLVPEALDADGLARIKQAFVDAAKRAHAAGFDVIELHCAHGYLLNSFLSPLTNQRSDAYGGTLENRMRLPLEIAQALRDFWPQEKPMFVRISAVDSSKQGVSVEDSVQFAKALAAMGVDVVDCSTGGIGRTYDYESGYGYQVQYAKRIKAETAIKTMAVGMIVAPQQAEAIVAGGAADLVAIGRQALQNPNFAHEAEQALGAVDASAPFNSWPRQVGWWLNGRQRKIAQIGEWQPAAETV